MIQKVDLNESRNLFVVSSILIPGIGGLSVSFGDITLTTVACALILGIVTNILLNKFQKPQTADNTEADE
jgi:uracil permease